MRVRAAVFIVIGKDCQMSPVMREGEFPFRHYAIVASALDNDIFKTIFLATRYFPCLQAKP